MENFKNTKATVSIKTTTEPEMRAIVNGKVEAKFDEANKQIDIRIEGLNGIVANITFQQ